MRIELENCKVNIIPEYPKVLELEYSQLTHASISKDGRDATPHANGIANYKLTGNVKFPCKLSVEAASYDYGGQTYYPFFRLSYNGAFMVGGFNGADVPELKDISIPSGATGVALAVYYKTTQKSTATMDDTTVETNPNGVLKQLYNKGDIKLIINRAD